MSWQILLTLLITVPVVLFSIGLIWYLNIRHKSVVAKTKIAQIVLPVSEDISGKNTL